MPPATRRRWRTRRPADTNDAHHIIHLGHTLRRSTPCPASCAPRWPRGHPRRTRPCPAKAEREQQVPRCRRPCPTATGAGSRFRRRRCPSTVQRPSPTSPVVRRGRDSGEETRAEHLRRCQAGWRAASPDSRLAMSKPAAATSSSAPRLVRSYAAAEPTRARAREHVALLLRTRRTGLLATRFNARSDPRARSCR